MLATTTLLLLPALAGQSQLDLHAEGLPMQGQELTLAVTAPAGTPFRLHSERGTSFGVTDESGRWQRSFRPLAAGAAHYRAVARTLDGVLLEAELQLTVQEAYEPEPGDVVLSELDRSGEWIELFNRTPYDLDLSDWTLRDDDGELYVIGKRILGARSHLVLAPGAAFTLDDDADEVVLTDTLGRDLDRLAYDVLAGWPAAVAGESLSGSPAGPGSTLALGSGAGAWSVSAQSTAGRSFCGAPATPGSANVCCGGVKGAPDVPDLDFIDLNCDGIDGDISRALFVSPSGSSSNPGSMDEPLDTIQQALALAAQDPTRDHVYVSEGTYAGPLVLVDGISLWGGFSEANGWQRSGAYVTTVRTNVASPEGMVGVLGVSLQAPITLGSLRVETANALPGWSQHNYGVLLQYSSSVTLEGLVVVPGAGGSGFFGAQGAAGPPGTYGASGSSTGVGGGYTYGAGSTGGRGGNSGNWNGYAGAPGFGYSPGNGGYGGGWIGDGGAGADAISGAPAGGTGAPPSNTPLIAGGLLVVAGLGSSGTVGAPGAGGGGGGGGSGNFFGVFGGGGGSGGSGGRGGFGGLPGAPGGSSVAVLLAATDARVEGCTLIAGNGGQGGWGGLGGYGGIWGVGGSGGSANGVTSGGKGGRGGAGGNGGIGAGGGGGHTYGLVLDAGSNVTPWRSLIRAGSAGGGGLPASAGGEAVDVKQL